MKKFDKQDLYQRLLLPLVAIVAVISFPVLSFGQASFQGLGDLPGGQFSSNAFATSADGSFVVGIGQNDLGFQEAFRWDSAGGMQGLGDLPGGRFLSSAQGISADGRIIVGLGRSALGPEAFSWDVASGIQGLDDLPGGNFSSRAQGVSDDGNTIVGSGVSSLGTEALVWHSGGGLQGLGDFPGGSFGSRATAVSATGNVIAGYGTQAMGLEAFRWDASGGMQALGDLSGGFFRSIAWGVSADGTTIVGESNSSFGTEAFRWNAIGGMQGLGDLPGGGFRSHARDCSSDGNVVVGQTNTFVGPEAFIWDATDGMKNLKSTLIVDYGVPKSTIGPWQLYEATSVSDNGRVIVGRGRNPQGNTEAWRVVLPPDNTGPTVTCSQSQTAECVAGGAEIIVDTEVFDADGDQLDVTWNITWPDGSTTMVSDTVTFDPVPVPTSIQLTGLPYFFPLGTSTVSLTVDDGVSEIEACSPITITVEDTHGPVIMSLMDLVEVSTDTGQCDALVDLNFAPYAPVFSDLCDPNITATNDAPALFSLGDTLVTWTVTDSSGNSLVAFQTVSVTDQEGPTGTPPADVVIGHDPGTCEATSVDLGIPTSDDNCGVTNISNDAMEPFPLGDTEINWYISDAAGNTIIVTQMVTVTNDDPFADAGPDQVLECNSNGGYELTLDGTNSSDADAGDVLEYHWEAVDITFDDADSGTPTATFPHGSTTVQLTVTDQCGGSSTTDLLIIVEDTTSPQIQAALVDQNVLWPPNHEMIPISLDLLVSDLCSAPEELIVICQIDSNEADDENGDGSSTGDVDGEDGYTQAVEIPLVYNSATERWEGNLGLRAERNGGGDGRKYNIRCIAIDSSGNATFATVCVTVPKSRGRGNR